MSLLSVKLRISVYLDNPYLYILFLLLSCTIPNFSYLFSSNLSLWSPELASCKLNMSTYLLCSHNLSFYLKWNKFPCFILDNPLNDRFIFLSYPKIYQVQEELWVFFSFPTAYSRCFLHLSSEKCLSLWCSNYLPILIATLAITIVLLDKFSFIEDLASGLQISIPSLLCYFPCCLQHLKWMSLPILTAEFLDFVIFNKMSSPPQKTNSIVTYWNF